MKKITIFILLFISIQAKADWSGTGFALNKGYVVTNYHVVEGANSIYVKGVRENANTEYAAKVVSIDKDNDIAIIQIDDSNFKGFGTIPYSIKRGMSDVGSYVWTLGYPLTSIMGNEIKFTDGKVSSKTGIKGSVNMYQITVPLQPGNSGGPLFDGNGNVIGITSAKLDNDTYNSENVNYAIKSSYLYNLVESALSPSIIPTGNALQGQSLEQKIKLAKKFVFTIICSDHGYKNHSANSYKTETRRMVSETGEVQVHNPKHLGSNVLTPIDVIINAKYTILIVEWTNVVSKATRCMVSPDAHICVMYDNPKGKKYKLLETTYVPIAPEYTEVPFDYTTEFILYFEPIDKNASEISMIEPYSGGLWRIQLY